MTTRPSANERRFWTFVGGVVAPVACFGIAAVFGKELMVGPEYQSGEFTDYARLLLVPEVFGGFAILIAAAALATWRTIRDPQRASVSVWTRGALVCGIAVSLQYLVMILVCYAALPLLLGLVPVAVLWAIDIVARRGMSRLGVLCLQFAALIVALGVAGEAWIFGVLGVLAMGPLWSLLAYVTALRMLPTPNKPTPLGRALWSSAYFGSWAFAIVQAKDYYEALPLSRPSCFVVEAAARGHARFVRSWDCGGRPVTRQLIALKAAEFRLAQAAPRLHRTLRRIYNRVGPPLARVVRSPWAADLAYLALKPVEALVLAQRLLDPGGESLGLRAGED